MKVNAEKPGNKERSMKRFTRKRLFFIVLLVIFLLLDSRVIWKAMYPVYFKQQIFSSASRYHVDPYLVMAIIQIESKFDQRRVSRKGAVGLMQLMPSTAKWVIKQANFSSMAEEYLDEPDTNISIGTWYISYLYDMFDRNSYAVIAAYNAGPGNVKRWIAQGVWDGRGDTISNIPFGETRHYIQRVEYYKERYSKIYQDEYNKP
ncbi:lytic transglycosylase domain-containing protein [Aneurinibacillus terranovensis]|uniref:lytic transglycosylase domain-containing protein n=1 Tax=Aneurinibacillus terranovensis TaxID=278991 RepID=UPI000423C708|nr:lytic transglycosylase domain-containing protein [Aneurinibacillus terranovensis]